MATSSICKNSENSNFNNVNWSNPDKSGLANLNPVFRLIN